MMELDRVTTLPISMRHPAWRWNAALLVTADRDNVSQALSLTKDQYIQKAVKFCRERATPSPSNRVLFTQRHPTVYEAFLINMSNNPNGGYKWQIEAMLMTQVSHAEIAANYMFEGGAETIAMYEKLFFDVAPYKDKPLCVLGNVLSSSLAANSGIDDYDYSWKAFAYSKGYPNLMEFFKFRTGSRLTKTLRKWFDEMTQDRVAYGAYSSSAKLRNMFNHQAMQVLDVASRYYSVSNSVMSKVNTGDNNTLAAKQILDALQDVILNPNIEKKIASNTDAKEPLAYIHTD
jgi:hypothetical protein